MNMSGFGLPPTNIVCVDCCENNDAQDDALPLLWHGYNLQTLVKEDMTRAPITVPTMVPFPPKSDVPPITTAAIACSS